MELGVRDWMIIVGVLLMLVVLFDGYRRMRQERRGNIRMSLNKQFLNSQENSEEPTSELPNGGARIVGRDGDPLDLEQSVPMLMDVDDCTGEQRDRSGEQNIEDLLDPLFAEPRFGGQQSAQHTEELQYAEDDIEEDIEPEPDSRPSPQPAAAKSAARSKPSRVAADPDEVMVINVRARGEHFKGPDLLHILLACDLRFGDMNIFHRHEQAGGKGAVQFSMANSVEPGTFDLDKIDDFSTPSVCFFMSVPGPEQPIKAFECMVETAQCLVTNLDGELLDESRSAMTNQTLEHCRQRLQEFERRKLTHA